MGLTYVPITLESVYGDRKREIIELLVDTGALYSLIPSSVLKRLSVEPLQRMEFELANGSTVERDVGEVRFRFDGRQVISPVIFGQETDSGILGVVTMEGMGLEVDPVRKQLRPTKLILY